LQLSAILQLLQCQQQQELCGQSSIKQAEHLAVPNVEVSQPEKKQRKRACKKPNCAHCSASPCGVCRPCRHPESRGKCILRYGKTTHSKNIWEFHTLICKIFETHKFNVKCSAYVDSICVAYIP
jgi:hypothetical protein